MKARRLGGEDATAGKSTFDRLHRKQLNPESQLNLLHLLSQQCGRERSRNELFSGHVAGLEWQIGSPNIERSSAFELRIVRESREMTTEAKDKLFFAGVRAVHRHRCGSV
jgi:hypothetical protein